MRGPMRKWIFAILLSAVAGCARAPLKSPEQSMRLAQNPPSLKDDLEFSTLIDGLDANIQYLRSHGPDSRVFRFGPKQISQREYVAALEYLLSQAKRDPSGETFRRALSQDFDAFEVYGGDDWGEVFITSYFEPVIDGSRYPTERFSEPLYGIPKDMVAIDLGSFEAVRPSLSALRDKKFEQRSVSNVLRGRLLPSPEPGLPPRVTVFPDRSQITAGVLNGQAIELVWVDPIDAFFLEIQGSGVVRVEDGSELKVGYAAQNGHPYVAIGKFLLDKIPLEKMSMQAIEAYLRSLPRDEAQRIMNLNPSYVFFRPLPNAGISFLGTEVRPGRTIATDRSLFPKGALAFLEFEKPVYTSAVATTPAQWVHASRFVLDQDTGGAIRGPGRVDLFWGRGAEAKRAAGVMRNKGRLFYFVPRPGLFERLP